jgi:hypothetical protein
MKNAVNCVMHYNLQLSENYLIFECERYLGLFKLGYARFSVLFLCYLNESNCVLVASFIASYCNTLYY